MNITVIYSNKRKNISSTYNAAQMIKDNLLGDGKLYEFYLPDDMPHVCRGCYACINGHEERCGGYEYMKPINDAINDSELIIFCTPVYVYHVSGQMKTLLDHFAYKWMVHRFDSNMLNKQAVIIVTAGGAGLKKAANDIKDSLDFWGIARTHIITQSVWDYNWSNMPEKFKDQTINKVKKTCKKVKKYSTNLTPSLKVKILFLMFRSFHKNNKMSKVDDKYWHDMGYTIGKLPWRIRAGSN